MTARLIGVTPVESTQLEHRKIAEEIENILANELPIVYTAYMKLKRSWYMHYDEQREERITELLDETKKETNGKAKDARYCYFPDIALSFNKTEYYHLALLLKDLTNLVDIKDSCYAQNLARAALLEVNSLDDDFMVNLCGARADGLKKYSLDNYRDEIPVQSLLDATARHLLEILRGEEYDKYSGFHHLGHIAANLIMIETQLRLFGEDK